MKFFSVIVILNLSSVTQSDYPWAPYCLKCLLQPFTQVIEKRVAMMWIFHQMPDLSFGKDLHVSSKRTGLEGIVISLRLGPCRFRLHFQSVGGSLEPPTPWLLACSLPRLPDWTCMRA